MSSQLQRLKIKLAWRFKLLSGAIGGSAAVGLLKIVRRMDPERSSDHAGRLLRRLGPYLPEHRVGRANLAAAYPEKPAQEIEEILAGVWDNLGRVAAEYAHLDRIWDFDPDRPNAGRIESASGSMDRFLRMRDDGKPALVFAAHLGNWELPIIAAAASGIDAAVIYRAPNLGRVAAAVRKIRAAHVTTVIPTTREAPFLAAAALDRGAHVGMLVDQHFHKGVEVAFFGRSCTVNPMLARLARHYDCPIHGVRAIRLPAHRFRLELTEAITPVRNDAGDINVQATMQVITSIIEGWVREHPEQWLWLHRRWR
jgi:KDO2-lipid IV(A) lauroyltransferase